MQSRPSAWFISLFLICLHVPSKAETMACSLLLENPSSQSALTSKEYASMRSFLIKTAEDFNANPSSQTSMSTPGFTLKYLSHDDKDSEEAKNTNLTRLRSQTSHTPIFRAETGILIINAQATPWVTFLLEAITNRDIHNILRELGAYKVRIDSSPDKPGISIAPLTYHYNEYAFEDDGLVMIDYQANGFLNRFLQRSRSLGWELTSASEQLTKSLGFPLSSVIKSLDHRFIRFGEEEILNGLGYTQNLNGKWSVSNPSPNRVQAYRKVVAALIKIKELDLVYVDPYERQGPRHYKDGLISSREYLQTWERKRVPQSRGWPIGLIAGKKAPPAREVLFQGQYVHELFAELVAAIEQRGFGFVDGVGYQDPAHER